VWWKYVAVLPSSNDALSQTTARQRPSPPEQQTFELSLSSRVFLQCQPFAARFLTCMKWIWPWLLAILSGVLLALGYAPFDQGWLAWIALTPLVCALWFSRPWPRWDALRVLGLGYLTGLAFFWISLHWVTEVTVLGWFVFAFYLALYPALWAAFVATVANPGLASSQLPAHWSPAVAGRRRVNSQLAPPWLNSWSNLLLALAGAAAWTGLEWIRGTLFTGFGWNLLGVTLHREIALIQIADITGVGGLSFLIVLANLIAVITVRRVFLEVGRQKLRPHFDFSLALALIAAVFSYGAHKVFEQQPLSTDLRIAAVQANIPQNEKWDPAFEARILETYRKQSEVAAALTPHLLIWPEAATPQPLLNDEKMGRFVVEILQKHGKDFLLGSVHYDVTGDYNSAILLHPENHAQLYHKMHLVPFGEFIPLRNTFPLFAWIIGNQIPSDFDAGDEPVLLNLTSRPVAIGALICFEDTLGDLARRFAERGAKLLVTLTNDGWFRQSAGSRQHLANAVFRSVETKLPLVRAANTGVTCFIDRLGRVTNELKSADGNTFIEGVLFGAVSVPVKPKQTIYTRYGELFSIACLFAALLGVRTFLWRQPPSQDMLDPSKN
jgi:apolipoprotein N-acyltransferase